MADAEVRELGEDFRFISSTRDLLPAIKNSHISTTVNLVASASKYGLVFIAFGSIIKVYRSSDLIDDNNAASYGECTLPGRITHLAVNCDNLTLLAAGNNNGGIPFAFYFDTRVFAKKADAYDYYYAAPLSSMTNSCVESVSWNPTDPSCVAVALSTGRICLINLKERTVIYRTSEVEASFVSWSAKGKQLAVGTTKGTLELFKTDLTPVRTINAPMIANIICVISINWFKDTEFFVCYRMIGRFPALFHVIAPKNVAATYVNMNDICYSGDESSRPHTYYSVYISNWSLLFALSSHSSDLAMLGKSDSNAWVQWIPEDGSRGALQFINIVEETFPLGFCSLLCSQKMFPGKDEKLKGPFPILLSLTTGGQLNIFHVQNNISGGTDTLTIVAESLPQSGIKTSEQYGTTVVNGAAPSPLPSQHPFDDGKVVASTPIKPPKSSPIPQTLPQTNSSFSQSSTTIVDKSAVFNVPQTSTPKAFPVQKFESVSPAVPMDHPNFRVAANITSSPVTKIDSNVAIPPSGAQFRQSNSNIINPSSFMTKSPQINVSKSPTTMGQHMNTVSTVQQPQNLTQLSQSNSGIATSPMIQPPQGNRNMVTTPTAATQQSKTAVATVAPATTPVIRPPLNGQLSAATSQSNHTSPVSSVHVEKPQASKRVKAKLIHYITNELVCFEDELKDHRKINTKSNISIGVEEDKKQISNVISMLGNLMSNVKTTVGEQSSEVSTLHEGTLENSALYEDAKLQCHTNKSVRNKTFAQLRPLDPYSRRKLDEIRSKYQYLQSQISNVNAMLDTEWQSHSSSSHEKSKEYGGKNYEMIHRSVLHLRKFRQTVEVRINKLCQLMKSENLGMFLLPPDDESDVKNTPNGNENVPRIGGKLSPKSMQGLQQFLSERTSTPVRNFSTPKRNVSMSGANLCLKINQDASVTSEPSPKQNPLVALKSFVSKTSNVEQAENSSVLEKALQASPKLPIVNPLYMTGIDAAAWQQYAMSMMNPLNVNLSMEQLAQSGALACMNISPAGGNIPSSTVPGVSNISTKPIYPNGSLAVGSMFHQPGVIPSTAVPHGSKPSFYLPSTVDSVQAAQAALAAQSMALQNSAKMFHLPFMQPVGADSHLNANISVKSPLIQDTTPKQGGGAIGTGTMSPGFPSQSMFRFNNTSFVPPNITPPESNVVTLNESTIAVQMTNKPDINPPHSDKSNAHSFPSHSQVSISAMPMNENVGIKTVYPGLNINVPASQKTVESVVPQITNKPLLSAGLNTANTFNSPALSNQFGTSASVFSSFAQKPVAVPSSPAISFLGNTQYDTGAVSSGKAPASSNVINATISQPPVGGFSNPAFGTSAIPNVPKIQNSGTTIVATYGSEVASVQTSTVTGESSVVPPSFGFGGLNIAQTTVTASPKTGMDPVGSGNSTLQHTGSTGDRSNVTVVTPTTLQSTFSGSQMPNSNITIFKSSLAPSFNNSGNRTTMPNSGVLGDPISTQNYSVFTSTANTASTGVSGYAPNISITAITSGSSVSGIASTTLSSSVIDNVSITPCIDNITITPYIDNNNTTPRIDNVTITPCIDNNITITPCTGVVEGVDNSQSANVFGVVPTTSGSSVFGDTSTTSSGGVFGAATATSSFSLFGAPVSTSSSSIFGVPVSTSSSSIFAGGVTSSNASVFGTAGSGSNSSVFGGPPAPSSNEFGGTAPVNSPSIFGVAPPANRSSIFGGSTANAFASGAISTPSVFGAPVTSQKAEVFAFVPTTSSSSAFGGAVSSPSFGASGGSAISSSSSIFGGFQAKASTNQFGSTAVTSSSIFGGTVATSSYSAFGGSAATSSGSIFGGSTATSSVFGGTKEAQSGFDRLQICSDLGKSPEPAKAAQNVFGNVGSTNSPSLFNTSSTPATNSVFGTPTATPSAFGAAPAFGTAAAFGGSASFGGGAVFGGSISSPVQQAEASFQNAAKPVFGNQSNTSTFGSVAQQASDSSAGKPSFGGNSFSSWR